MGKCPVCKAEVEYLTFRNSQLLSAKYNGIGYDEVITEDIEGLTTYTCPKCRVIVTNKEEEARRIFENNRE